MLQSHVVHVNARSAEWSMLGFIYVLLAADDDDYDDDDDDDYDDDINTGEYYTCSATVHDDDYSGDIDTTIIGAICMHGSTMMSSRYRGISHYPTAKFTTSTCMTIQIAIIIQDMM